MKNLIILLTIAFAMSACSENGNKSDAYGNFEADDFIISAEANGKILSLNIEEGQQLKTGENVALIDTIQLSLQKAQVIAKRKAVATKITNILAQIDVLNEQRNTLVTEKNRIDKLFKDDAATQQNVDEIAGKLNIVESQIKSVKTQNATVLGEVEAYDSQINITNDLINKCKIKNPTNGTVLEKYLSVNELAFMGKPIYKIANLENMNLRIYISGSQLPNVKLGQSVKVFVDETTETNRELQGEISWISSKAEFTPKIIQTKEERVNLVYAVKVKVKNDGSLKIGMPGEVVF